MVPSDSSDLALRGHRRERLADLHRLFSLSGREPVLPLSWRLGKHEFPEDADVIRCDSVDLPAAIFEF